jgi:oligopeptide/dipeptide ABC transporter ATP-binding protein
VNAAGNGGDGVLLRAEGVIKHFAVGRRRFVPRSGAVVQAVDGVSLEVRRGETLGLVGETGCGKSTLGRCLTRLYDLTAGRVEFDGHDISALSRRQMRPYRRRLQLIFQDPYGSLNPRRRIGSIIGDPFAIHGVAEGRERMRQVQELMELVGLNAEHYNRFPSEFSGGQRQRIGIARALALRPELVICDEPVSALDVSIQAQIVNLLADLQNELGLTYVFIAHDLSVVRHVSDRIAVMYLGKIVEIADAKTLFERPRHPYTAALLSALPVPDPDVADARQRILLSGDVPSPVDPPSGCRFHPRCPKAREECSLREPALEARSGDSPRHQTACHFPIAEGDELALAAHAEPPGAGA